MPKMPFCKHCCATIKSLDDVPKHRCFIGKNVFINKDNKFFYTHEYVETNEQNDVLENAEVFDDDANHQCQVEEYATKVHENSGVTKEMSFKQNAVWTKNATLTLLSLYEANLHKVDHKNKKIQLWTTISAGLYSFDIKMSPDQVRWKINALIKKYKESLHGTGSNNARIKLELERQWLQYLKINEDRFKATDERYEKYLKVKTDENQFKKRYLNLREREIEQKNTITAKKLKVKQDIHNEKMELERLKCNYLAKLADSKKEMTDADSD
ncbi:hypothetical protein RF55_15858 [Lasius niger]|uniref:Myb/SANT-like DNA-binding domain-containing protein n=1 Tax=Lasius niger TaxID=67767 RepID=A0A0J7K5J6_LASNI|nr:hypothetical protein RF55_15858 [Lasius niger]